MYKLHSLPLSLASACIGGDAGFVLSPARLAQSRKTIPKRSGSSSCWCRQMRRPRRRKKMAKSSFTKFRWVMTARRSAVSIRRGTSSSPEELGRFPLLIEHLADKRYSVTEKRNSGGLGQLLSRRCLCRNTPSTTLTLFLTSTFALGRWDRRGISVVPALFPLDLKSQDAVKRWCGSRAKARVCVSCKRKSYNTRSHRNASTNSPPSRERRSRWDRWSTCFGK